MILFFPDRDSLGREPLGFLLRETEHASTPLLPLALGFRRNLLVADLSLINEGPFCADSLYISPSPCDQFAPISLVENRIERQIALPRTQIRGDNYKNIINSIAQEILFSLRRELFSAHRNASFDCWRFSNLIATKLTFTTLFGTDAVADEQTFSYHAEIIRTIEDSIYLDVILKHYKNRDSKIKIHRRHANIVNFEIGKLYDNKRHINILPHTTEPTYYPEWIANLAISVSQTTSIVLFWIIHALSRNTGLREIVEKEADACLLCDGDLNINKLHTALVTKNLIIEIMRLAPARNLILFEAKSRFILRNNNINRGDRIIICPNAMFRSMKHFSKANEIRIDRKYDSNFFGLLYLANGGRIVFRLVLLNLMLLLLDLAAAFELEFVDGPAEFEPAPCFGNVRPDIKVRLNLRRSKLFG